MTNYFIFTIASKITDMKRLGSIALIFSAALILNSCGKEEYLKSESGIKSQLQGGTWHLIPIPKYDDAAKTIVHVESWTFGDDQVSIINGNQTAQSSYSVHTSLTKAEIKLEDVQPLFVAPGARIRDNNGSGTWQIIRLDDDFLVIANDQDGQTGLTELEFEKK
jgi:hypothetical protein